MEVFQKQNNEEEEEEEEEVVRLSFSNFSLEETSSPTPKHSPPRSDPLFEFLTTTAAATGPGDVIFCGKIIRQDQDELNEYEKRDYFANIRSESLRKPDRASSRFTADMDYHAQSQLQRVNITSLTSMSAKSRRRMFMFGPVKFKPEMELGDIKRRQMAARRPPQEKRANEMEIVRPSLRRRSYLVSVLARSFSCIQGPPGGAAVERRVGMVN